MSHLPIIYIHVSLCSPNREAEVAGRTLEKQVRKCVQVDHSVTNESSIAFTRKYGVPVLCKYRQGRLCLLPFRKMTIEQGFWKHEQNKNHFAGSRLYHLLIVVLRPVFTWLLDVNMPVSRTDVQRSGPDQPRLGSSVHEVHPVQPWSTVRT